MKITKKIKNNILPLILLSAVLLFGAYYESSNKKALSVVIPIYNVSNYLPKCLDSLLSQPLPNIEIICVNDGSKDNSLEILNDYAKKDNRIIIISQENHGVSSARNAGIKASHGEYLTFVDPDDYIDTDAYEKCMDKLHETNADVLVFDYIIEPENKQPIKLTDKKYSEPFESLADSDINTGFVWNKIFKSSVLSENNILFKEDLSYAEDNLFVNMVLPKSKFTVTCPGVFYHYQYHSDSSGNSIKVEKQLDNTIKRCSYIIDYYTNEGYTNRYKWVLDYCLAITYDYVKDMPDKSKQKYYCEKLLNILYDKLLFKVDDIPEHLNTILQELKSFTYL